MKTDMQLKTDVSDELAWNPAIDAAAIGVAVHEGVVTLSGKLNTFAEKHAAERAVRRVASGELDWGYQYASAEQAIRPLLGVRGLTNNITVKPRVSAGNLGGQITAALTRQAQREAHHIGVEVEGGIVTLSGQVHSMAEHDAAIGTALSARGVSRVVDHLRVAA